MKEHLTILGALYVAFSIIGIFAAIVVLVAVTGGGVLSQDPDALWITSLVGISVSSMLFVLSAPGLIAGVGLLKTKSWARILALILGCANLVSLPFGTALGVYTIWVLTKPEVIDMLERDRPSAS